MGNGTSIGRVRGLGAAHHGTHHWLLQRFTAIGNLLALTFLMVSFVLLPDRGYAAMRDWVANPLTATALALLVISVFWHARLGVQVMMEDYVHTPANKFAALAALNLAVFGGAAFALLSIARIVFAGGAA